jgi:hypothetical protein
VCSWVRSAVNAEQNYTELCYPLAALLALLARALCRRWLLVSGASDKKHFSRSIADKRYRVGCLYLWAGDAIRKGAPNGLEAALGALDNNQSIYPTLTLPDSQVHLLFSSSPLYLVSARDLFQRSWQRPEQCLPCITVGRCTLSGGKHGTFRHFFHQKEHAEHNFYTSTARMYLYSAAV